MGEHPSFGAWLRKRRKALDLTQTALAERVGCSVVSIRKFEGDEQRPSRQQHACSCYNYAIDATCAVNVGDTRYRIPS